MVTARLETLRLSCSTTSWGTSRWQQGLAAVVTALIFSSQAPTDAAAGLDPSWETALALARDHDLAWGPQIVFTSGPLGFLHNSPYYYFGQSVAAACYQIIVLTALFLGVAAALRPRHAPMTSLVGAFVTTGIANFLIVGLYPDLAVLAAFAWASVPLLQQAPKRSTVYATCITLGAVAGFALLVKINSGPTILALALAVSLLADWQAIGRHLATLTAFVLSTLIWWALAGQHLGKLPVWLKLSGAVASGYVDGMAVPLPVLSIPTVAFTIAWLALLCVTLIRGGPEIPRRLVFLIGLASVLIAKSAFGRFDAGHVFILLALVVVAVAVIPGWETRRRALVMGAVAALFLSLVGPPLYERSLGVVLAPVRAVNRLATLAVPGRLDGRVEQSKARQRAVDSIPPAFIDAIGAGTVHVDPSETSAAWAYNLAWRPAPVFQTYAAFTPALDALNSDELANGPQFVLSHVSPTVPATGIDGRLATQESPLYSRTLLCDYTLNGVQNHWALFVHTGPHCGPLTPLSQIADHDHAVITIPAPSGPGKAVLVGIDLDRTQFDRLFQGTIVPLTASTAVVDGVSYRLVTANAAEPFLVNSPTSVKGTNLEIHAHTISVGRRPSWGLQDVSARLRFYEMQVEP